jgi:hypothetical protein
VCLLDCRKWATRQVLYLAADDGTTGVDSATAGAAAAAAAAVLRTPQDVSGICFSPSVRGCYASVILHNECQMCGVFSSQASNQHYISMCVHTHTCIYT